LCYHYIASKLVKFIEYIQIVIFIFWSNFIALWSAITSKNIGEICFVRQTTNYKSLEYIYRIKYTKLFQHDQICKKKTTYFFLFLLFFVVICFAILEHFESSHLIKGKKLTWSKRLKKNSSILSDFSASFHYFY
jgi:hypothetical protein